MATPLPEIRCRMTLDELARATGGALRGEGATVIQRISLDTRTLQPDDLFVALAGERYDAHAHLAEAVARGARCLVVRRGTALSPSVDALEVDDTLVALASIARHHGATLRASGTVRVVAIGGAVGKTTTKELTRAAMQAAFGPCHATLGNLNNLVGAPVTLLGLDASHAALVLECGTNAPGEIARIGAMVEPDVAMVMNADATHTEGLGSIEGVAREEGSLFGFARRAVVGNADEPLSRAEMARAGAGVVRRLFGVSPEADVRVVGRVLGQGGVSEVTLALSDALGLGASRITVNTGLFGEAVATNIAAALCATAAAGADRDAIHRAAAAIASVRPVEGRFNVLAVGRSVVIDDTYNASPRAVRAALAAAREVAAQRGARLVVALGDMLELGSLAASAHREMGVCAAEAGAAVLVTAGPEMARAAHEARERGVETVVTADAVAAAAALDERVREGDVVLVKGSRGMRMERCVAGLRRALA